MNIIIQSLNFRASFALESFVRKKVNKLFKQSRGIENVSASLCSVEKGKIENKSCEIRLAIPGNDPVVKKVMSTMKKRFFRRWLCFKKFQEEGRAECS
jgi:ribosome-associated translation inhibitor RaiA